MSRDQLEKSDTNLDEKFNPSGAGSHLYEQENDPDDFNDFTDNYGETADGSQEDANIARAKAGGNKKNKNIDKAKDGEENPMNYSPSKYGGNKSQRGRPWTKGNVKAVLRKKGPIGLIVTIFAVGGIGLGGLLTTSLAPIAFIENVTKDLKTDLAAVEIRGTKVFRSKIPKDAGKVLKGCTVLSLRCKLKTISTAQQKRLAAKGIEVVDAKKAKIGGKWRLQPTKYRFQGQEYNARAFSNEIRKPNGALRTAYTRANNMKFLSTADANFKNMMKRFGISKKPPELKGSKKDKVNILMNKANTSNPEDVKFTEFTGDDGEPYYELDGDTSDPPRRYKKQEKIKMEKAAASAVKATQPPSRAKANAIKGISVVGAADMACTIKNMVGLAAVSAKVANKAELIKYAMPVAASVQQIKAGDGNAADGEIVGEFFGSTDNRKKIVDLAESIQTTGNGKDKKVGPVQGDTPMKDNPDYGKNAMDSPLYKMSSTGKYNTTTLTESQYSLGVGQRTVMKDFANFASALEVTDSTCKTIQNWFVRSVGMIGGVALAVGTGGFSLLPQAAMASSMFVAIMVLQSIISNAVNGSVLSAGMEDAPMDRGAAVWSGMAGMHASSAQTRGMIPGTKDQIVAYQGAQNKTEATYIAAERAETGPFDINNQYSFLGSFARSLLPYASSSTNVASTTGNLVSLVSESFGSILSGTTSQASAVDTERFEQCDDEGYAEMKLAPDVQCNLRFVMPQADLNRDPDAVMDYMENNGYVEKDTETGLPVGYTPPAPEESQNFAMAMLKGAKDTFYNDRNYGEGKGAEYGKFLDYCAYRALPFGKTFEENGAYGSVDDPWLTGERCLSGSEKISNFRTYTMDKTVMEAMDEDEINPVADSVEAIDQSEVVVASGEWSNPAPAYTTTIRGFGYPVVYDSHVKIGGGFGHNGIDMSGTQKAEDAFAACDGVISSTKAPKYNAVERTPANTIMVDCGGGVTVGYHHAAIGVSDGSTVKAGQKIGRSDLSGDTSGYHVHVTVRVNGKFVDPVPFFKDKGIELLK